MSEKSDKIEQLPAAPDGPATAPSVEKLLKRKKPKKKYKDLRRRPPTGLASGHPRKLSDVQLDELRGRLAACWGIVKTYKHYAPLWSVSEETIRKAIAEIQAEWARVRETVPAEERAANVLEQIQGFVRRCYEAHEAGDAHALKGIPAALDRIAKIEGAFAPERRDVSTTGSVSAAITIGDMNPEQVQTRVAELMRKYGSKILMATDTKTSSGGNDGNQGSPA